MPDIGDIIVEIKSFAREPGERTKIAVWSKDDKVDPVGACVGMRGSRVKDIVKELQGERVDIVRWNDDIKEYVKAALSPAEAKEIKVNKENKKVEVLLPDDQLSIGIGKHGQNVRLASKMTGWEIYIVGKEKKESKKPETVEAEVKTEAKVEAGVGITEIEGVGPKTAKALVAAGYDTVDKIKGLTVEDLVKVDGIGEKTAEKIIKSVKKI